MNVEVRHADRAATHAASRLAIADCDLHLGPTSITELYPWLSKRWQTHLETYGMNHRTGLRNGLPSYPKAQPAAARRDAWPPSGKPPGTDLDFTRAQHLDAFNVTLGIVNPPTPSNSTINGDLGNALAHAWNEWQVACLVTPEPRLRGSIVVNYEDPAAAVSEIERCAGNPAFAQVQMMSRIEAPMGNRRYFPIFQAAARAGLPVGVHAFGFNGRANTGSGWLSFYIEDMVSHAQCFQAHLASMVIEGVFERLPDLRFVLIEGGFGWVPSLCWRMDRAWKRLRDETPDLKRLPSETVHEQVWFTTQPMEEPENAAHLADTIGWIGWDRLLFASDYPHWDFDDPARALPLRPTEAQRESFFRGNAERLYRRR
jgi:predicted TIM-barrel fold metal-dependent hydrolase